MSEKIDRERGELTDRQENIIQLMGDLGELKAYPDPSPRTSRMINEHERRLYRLQSIERFEDNLVRIRELLKKVEEIERQNIRDRKRMYKIKKSDSPRIIKGILDDLDRRKKKLIKLEKAIEEIRSSDKND